MKQPKMFIIFCLITIGSILLAMHVQHRSRMKILDINHKQTMLLTEKVEDLKKQFQGGINEAVTKADLVALAEINRYQSEKDMLYIDNKFELSGGYPQLFPDYFIVILILCLSFQLGNISKKIDKQSGPDKMGIE